MAGFIPEGSYQKTSQNISVTMYCEAQRLDQSWISSGYPISQLTEPNAGLANWDGYLAPEEGSYPAKGFIPEGPYKQTCRNIRVTLGAKCQKKDGNWHYSALDITNYDYDQGDIANVDGVLKIVPKTGVIIANYIGLFDGDETTKLRCRRTDIPYDMMNRLYIAFARIKQNKVGEWVLDYGNSTLAWDPESINIIIQNCMKKNPSVEVFISCGYNGDDYHNAAKRADSFADSVVDFINKNVVSVVSEYVKDNIVVGFDMDLEACNTTVDDVSKLVKALRDRFNQEYTTTRIKYLLTITPWVPGIDSLDWKSIVPYLDQINLMYTYGSGAEELTTLYNNLINQGVKASQIIAGIQSETPQDSFSTIDSKCGYIRDKKLGGMMNWRVDNDTNHDLTYSFAKRMYNDLK